ncbi:hypothetical protein Bhyg_11678 [Pseudolycoriella hygida]|uniref:Uncharacterized protein n=1 Tax=Pseudolycoriella hygida TaxID=35572 RepID=A0A9Q0RYL0_9DIPT|nr:hypothetical protein Bhyg_11678 [Pseudolycoriella hygida]
MLVILEYFVKSSQGSELSFIGVSLSASETRLPTLVASSKMPGFSSSGLSKILLRFYDSNNEKVCKQDN